MHGRGQGRKPRAIVLIVLGSLFVFVALAWGAELLLTGPEDVPPLVVTQDDEVLAEFSMDDLRELPTHSYSQFGKSGEGPAVLDVLSEAGVAGFERLIVHGPAVRDDGLLVLERGQVTEEVVLDFANRGTVKIAGPDIEWEDRVRDVIELEVE